MIMHEIIQWLQENKSIYNTVLCITLVIIEDLFIGPNWTQKLVDDVTFNNYKTGKEAVRDDYAL